VPSTGRDGTTGSSIWAPHVLAMTVDRRPMTADQIITVIGHRSSVVVSQTSDFGHRTLDFL
jgi:NO-binding membrane sensor protein with MHYT domain